MACPASLVLPHVHSIGQAAEDGVAIHDFVRAILAGHSREDALAATPKRLFDRCAAIDLHKAIGDLEGARAEVAFALHLEDDAVRLLGENIGRDYEVEPSELPGTLDVIGRHWEGYPVVVDWKTGQTVTPCRRNAQMLYAATVAMRHFEAPEVEGRIVYLHEDGTQWIDRHRFDLFDADCFVKDIRAALREVKHFEKDLRQGIVPNVREGDHCRYCPAMHACPAKVSLARSMVSDVESLHASVQALTPEQAGAAWLKLEKMKKLAEMVEDQLRSMARQTPIVLSETHELREQTHETSVTDSKKLEALARAKGASDDELAACKVTRQVTSVRKLKREKVR